MDRIDYRKIEDLPLILTPKDVANVLGVSRNRAYETFNSKDFPAFRVGKQLRVQKARFQEWMDTQAEANAKEKSYE